MVLTLNLIFIPSLIRTTGHPSKPLPVKKQPDQTGNNDEDNTENHDHACIVARPIGSSRQLVKGCIAGDEREIESRHSARNVDLASRRD